MPLIVQPQFFQCLTNFTLSISDQFLFLTILVTKYHFLIPLTHRRCQFVCFSSRHSLTDGRPSRIDILNRLPTRLLFDNDMSHVFVLVFHPLQCQQMYNYLSNWHVCNGLLINFKAICIVLLAISF